MALFEGGILILMQYVKTLMVEGREIEYVIRKRKNQARYVLAVRRGGRVTLTIPYSISFQKAEAYIFQKKAWLESVFQKYPQKKYVPIIEQKRDYQKHKETARRFVSKRIAELNEYYGFTYKRIAIRRNNSRWGSCSALGNLNFDYRILFLPSHLQDYLLVHELCHLQEMNHSKQFWCLVGQTVPEYKKNKKELQAHQL
jgi:predicted metal-dependent hydrolase